MGAACMDIAGRICDGRNQIPDSFLTVRGSSRFTQPVKQITTSRPASHPCAGSRVLGILRLS